MLNTNVLVYLDDILIFSKNIPDHLQHLRQALDLLRQHKLYAKLPKCEFFKSEVSFLGHVISAKGIQVDKHKTQTIKNWPIPQNLKELQSFIGLANYYRRFIS